MSDDTNGAPTASEPNAEAAKLLEEGIKHFGDGLAKLVQGAGVFLTHFINEATAPKDPPKDA